MASDAEQVLRLMLGGDVMLGRLVREHIRERGPSYPLGELAPLMQQADLAIVNLECAVTTSRQLWPGAPKAFYFGTLPEAVHTLVGAGVSAVSLANNHTLDFGVSGLLETLHTLRQHDIRCAGAGRDIDEARAPIFVERRGIKFGMVAYCDHQEDFAADVHSPGIAYLDLGDEEAAIGQFRRSLERIREEKADWPILSLHWGPNMVDRPSERFVRLAHAAIDMGYGILFGHSAHVFQGIEIYRGRPIIYAAGDLVDDYYVDPVFRNDHQLLFELELTRSSLKRIRLHPVFIEDCRAVPARGRHLEYIAQRAIALCAEMGTRVEREGDQLLIAASTTSP
jgi:poly-gamma-glutamate synthesis protein (capsule biosynthesis protein)